MSEEEEEGVEQVVRSFTELGCEPEHFRLKGYAGQRVGEASNPGPELRVTTANVTSLLPHLPYVTSIRSDILALQEVRLTIDGQAMIRDYLKECGWVPLWRKPQPVRPGTRH